MCKDLVLTGGAHNKTESDTSPAILLGFCCRGSGHCAQLRTNSAVVLVDILLQTPASSGQISPPLSF